MFFTPQSVKLQCLPDSQKRPPRAAASFNHRVDRTAAEPRRFVEGWGNSRNNLDVVAELIAAVGHSRRSPY